MEGTVQTVLSERQLYKMSVNTQGIAFEQDKEMPLINMCARLQKEHRFS